MSSKKYNRTLHLPWSKGRGDDDKVAKDVSSLLGKHIIITEKMDGSNASLESDGCFARTHSGPPTHTSFDGLKALHASIKYNLSEGFQFFGEWLYALHSIAYEELPGYFLLFAVRHEDIWKSWDYVIQCSLNLKIPTVPVVWSGRVETAKELEALTSELAGQKSICGGEREGLVVRLHEEFEDKNFSKCVMKYVRANHVQTTEHWKDQEIVKNGLKSIS